MPGWDSGIPGSLPKGYADFNEDANEEPQGYFSRYEKQKSLRRQSSLDSDDNRLSSSLPAHEPLHHTLSLRRSSLKETEEVEAHHMPLERLKSMPITAGEKFGYGFSTSPTDQSPGLHPSSLDAYKIGRSATEGKPYQWWRKLSSSALNEVDESDTQDKDNSKSYTPQHNITGQKLNYRVEDDGPSIIPAH